jgi:predicted O-methyltransferase YrrM
LPWLISFSLGDTAYAKQKDQTANQRFGDYCCGESIVMFKFFRKLFEDRRLHRQPNLRGTILFRPGHYYSPLLDIQGLAENEATMPFDGEDWWEHVNLRHDEQKRYFEDVLDKFPLLPFPNQRTDDYRYFADNTSFVLSDAFTLSAIIRKEKPRRIIEIGAGFSSAVMLDTLDKTQASAVLTFIEPDPPRLHSILSNNEKFPSTILVQLVQEVPLSVFDKLKAQDVLFIDSSHVAKVGSDVTFLLLRILPRLKPGVLVHFHDIFYPFSYPTSWIREGRAWNESLFLRAFLVGNEQFEVVAFNCYARHAFPELFRDRFPEFLNSTGGSLWLRKVA